MKAITADEMKKLESFAVDIGIPSRILMEMAGMKVANTVLHEIKRVHSVCLICGGGGNGGDGFVAARYLHNSGIRTTVYLVGRISSKDSIENLNVLGKLGVEVTEIVSPDQLAAVKSSVMASDIVIDAIFGTGFKGEARELESQLIDIVNLSKREVKDRRPYMVISVDIPSGSDGTSGEALKHCVAADVTVTFEYPKIGLLKSPASKFAGKIVTASIGIPRPNPVEPEIKQFTEAPSLQETPEGMNITDSRYVSSVIPRRKADANKSDCGKVLVVAGSSGMMGAAVLTANAAMRTGSGLVTLCVPDDIKDMVNSMSLEVITSGFKDLKEKLRECDVIAIGPGLSKGSAVEKLVNEILLSGEVRVPIVLDADGLNAIKDLSVFKRSNKDLTITPHPGEFSRLTGIPIEEVRRDRAGHASNFAQEHGLTVVLKGAYSVIANKDRTFINPIANPGMATAGSGDVLTGIIASLIGQGLSSMNAAVAGAYIHGMSGNLVASLKGEHGMLASDIIDSIPYTFSSLL